MGVITRSSTRWRARSLAAGVAGAALALASCSASTSDSESSDGEGMAGQELDVWFPGTLQAEIDLVNDTIIPAFEEETGATVNATFVDWGDMSPKLNAAFAAGTAPDVFGHGPAAVADFTADARVEPLTEYVDALSEEDRTDLEGALPGGQVDGTQYLIPLSIQGSLIMYDAEAFEAAGLDPDNPPQTWEEIGEAGEALTERDGSGNITRAGLLLSSQAIARQQVFTALLYGQGGQMLDDDGMAAFDSAEGAAALDFFTDLYDGENAVSTDLGADYLNSPAAQQPLVLGTAAMTLLGAPQMESVVEAAPDKDLRVIPPTGFGSNEPAAIGGAGPGLMINADRDVKDLGWEFISYMISPEISTQYTEGIGAVPVRASAADSDYVSGSLVMQAYLEANPYWVSNPNVVGWVEIRDSLDQQLEQALNQVVSSDEALTAAADTANQILEENS